MSYEQSTTLAQIKAKHPFPWREQRYHNLVRMVDANDQEVILFEMTALCALFTRSIAAAEQQRTEPPKEESKTT